MRKLPGKLERTFAKRLKELRGETSQLQFSKRLQIAQSTLNRLENLEQSASLHIVERIAERLKVPVEKLLF
jgi:transcriptional regulator with XRE-family HTH domain